MSKENADLIKAFQAYVKVHGRAQRKPEVPKRKPDIEGLTAFINVFEPIPEGLVAWVPCAGNNKHNMRSGHTGEIRISRADKTGTVKFRKTHTWLTSKKARESVTGILKSNSHGHCPTCFRLVYKDDEDLSMPVQNVVLKK